MTTVRTVLQTGLLAVLAIAGATGCVERKFVVESNIPNAQVYIDNRSIGAAPAYSQFDYYGYYTVQVVHPGYEIVTRREHIAAPWYAYPPFDLITEILPCNIRDTRRIYVELHEAPQVRTDDILQSAEILRQRATVLPIPENPAAPRIRPGQPQPAGPILQPPVVPGIGPGPAPGIGPGVGPAPGPGPAPGVVPSVTPGYTPPESSYLNR
jgi:hypothetical protein